EYSVWKPKGFLFLSLKLPTAPSGYESTEPLQTDSYGKGFYQLGIGSLFVKRIRSFELLLSPSVVGYRPESYFLDGENRKIEPGLSGIFRYGVTYFFKKQPLQVSAQHVLRYDDKTKIAGLNSSAVSYYQDLILNLNYDFNGYSLSGFYSNQNVFGPSKNTSLETSVGIQFTSSYDL
ncbi:MAG: hypothetical protein KDD37_04955, partial [Bdellovibrionales bacterium]|nr:hypothetical protein [Bdellovibrionales bacterium]